MRMGSRFPLTQREKVVLKEGDKFTLRAGADVRRNEAGVQKARDECGMIGGKQPPAGVRLA